MVRIADRSHLKDLQESEKKYRELFETMAQGVVYQSADGTITSANPAAERILGLTLDQMQGRTSIDPRWNAIHKDGSDFPGETHPAMEALRTRQPVRNVIMGVFNPSTGKYTWIKVTAMPKFLSGNDNLIEVITTFEDITELKLAEDTHIQSKEEIRMKNEELLKLNTEKDKFFSIIAHDLRSPFNNFLGFTQMMVEDLHTLRLDEIQMIALSMRKSATNLYALLENLLEWSRVQRGLITFHPEPLLLTTKIDEILQPVKESARQKNIEITSHIPGDLVIYTDERMLASILRNITSNAVKFTPKGGKIIVAAKSSGGNGIEISVTDTGIGMSQKMIDSVFMLSAHVNRQGTEGEQSTGLGLMICKDFIEKHGGTLTIESKEGKGSTFRIILPNQK